MRWKSLWEGHESVQYSHPVGACLLQYWKVWRELGVDPRVVKVLRKGFTIKFLQPCPLTSVAGYSRLPTDPVKLAVLDEEVQQMTLKAGYRASSCRSELLPLFVSWFPRKEGSGDLS